MSLCIPNTCQQVQDTGKEDCLLSSLLESVRLAGPPLESDSEPERRASLRPPGYTSPHADVSVSDGTIALHTQDASDGSQSCRNSILLTNPRPEPWFPASTRIPPELFDTILFYLCLDSDPDYTKGQEFLRRAIMLCSLVCLRWANLCREALFRDKELFIDSSEKERTLVKYATQGCPSLVPIHKLIESISVEQGYDVRHSFCDRVYMFKAKFGVRLSSLTLDGPVPEGFPPCKLDTPHWGLPPSVITPPSLLSYDKIYVLNVHLPSFRHVVKYVRHFAQAGRIVFDDLTWDTNGQEPQLPSYRRGSRKVENKNLEVSAEDCTDNFLLCLLVAAIHPCWRSLLCMLPDDESQQITLMIRGFRELWGKKNLEHCALQIQGPEESEELPIIRISADLGPAWYLTFHLCNLAAENAQTSDVHVVGVALDVRETGEKVNVDSMIAYLGHFPMLCAALLRFRGYKGLLAAMECHRPLSFNPRPAVGQGCSYVFTCLRPSDNEFPEVPRAQINSYGLDYVEIDPITLSPTGRSWAYKNPYTSDDLGLLLTRESLRKTGNIPPSFHLD
ncbi:hypothetical protein BDY19DRAFT_744018 [Irpex rosettiformis]|uniref:Uncharacterized protein n=1 Tax=Irpex rosettiformis TaxID=378272 RepID=A0ACB8TMG3_9APHY|nr:hypothetical protein BDY19DRAFT_744018 [Irpex rosettiformis]